MEGASGSVNVMLPKVVMGDLLHCAPRGRDEGQKSEKHQRDKITNHNVAEKKKKLGQKKKKKHYHHQQQKKNSQSCRGTMDSH